jgi:phospholipid/cholesterol/gamma-HCH transport system substrate-binding protein
MEEQRLERRVALLLLVAVASGVGLLYLVGAFQLRGGQVLHVDFAHSGGVPEGAAVKMAGVAVGRVRAVHLLPERRDDHGEPLPVRMDLSVENEVLAALHTDAKVSMAMQGALGEPFLEVSSGSANAPLLKAGAELRGIDPPRLDQLIAKLDDLVELFHAALAGGDREQARQLLQSASGLARTADQLLLENRDTLTQTLREVSATVSDMRDVVAEAKTLMTSGKLQTTVDDASQLTAFLKQEVPPLTRDARKLTTSATNIAGDFTPQDGAELKATLVRLEAASERLESISARADTIVQEIEAGKGTAGGLYKDPKVYEDLKALVSDLKAHPWKVLWK